MKKYILFLVGLLMMSFSLHKFHLSNTKIVYVENEKVIQITMRCFVDDIENALNKENHFILELGNDRELKESDKYLTTYLKEHFKIQLNDKKAEIIFLGKEVEKDIVFFYLEIKQVESIASIQVESTVLLNNFEDQQNVIRLEVNNKKKTFVLKNNNNKDTFDF